MARLFEQCGWTQERIATRMGAKQQWVSRRLIFGRFLSSTPAGVNTENLTERRFRDYWKRTKGREAEAGTTGRHNRTVANSNGRPTGTTAAIRAAKPGTPLRKLLAQRLAADPEVKPLAKNGEVGNGRSVADSKPTSGGTTAAYIVRRLKRDAPEVAAALAAGEYPSARAAETHSRQDWAPQEGGGENMCRTG